MLDSKASKPQPPPVAGKIDVAPVVIADIEARMRAGLLQTHNGRSALWDLYDQLDGKPIDFSRGMDSL